MWSLFSVFRVSCALCKTVVGGREGALLFSGVGGECVSLVPFCWEVKGTR